MPLLAAAISTLALSIGAPQNAKHPNVVLVMADDLGYGDVGFLGNAESDTPRLDRQAKSGVILTRFYSASSVCSPTRASFLTGRHPSRMGIHGANEGHLPHAEFTLAECLGEAGYTTGFFGKWHLGTLTRRVRDSNRGGIEADLAHYSPPQEHGFDEVFATEAKVPTFNPMVHPDTGEPYGTRYWDDAGHQVLENLDGDDSRVIMDRALAFIDQSVDQASPFLAVIWFHAPHLPVVASPQAKERYKDSSPMAQAYRGSIHDMDQQLGRLFDHLQRKGVDDNTFFAFCSDNGPEGQTEREDNGSTAGLRGRKRSLYEGGVRVPALVRWPKGLVAGSPCNVPASTSDWMATTLEVCGESGRLPDRPSDGMSILSMLRGKSQDRPRPIGFRYRQQRSWIDNNIKWIQQGDSPGQLFDLAGDAFEENDIAAENTPLAAAMESAFKAWSDSCSASATGQDYGHAPTVIPVSRPTAKNPAAGWKNGTDWLDQHAQSRAIGSKRDVRVVLLGDSITQGFGDPARSIGGAGGSTFDKLLAPLGCANFGMSGDRTQHVLWRLEHGALDHVQPAIVVLNIGTNNLKHNPPEEIVAGVDAVLHSLAKQAPEAEVRLLGIFPRGQQADHPDRAKLEQVNRGLASIAEGHPQVSFHDLGSMLLLEDGQANPARMTRDFVHLSAQGYEVWGHALQDLLTRSR